MEKAVRLENVTQVYVTEERATLALQGITFDVPKGEFVSLIGPSGCGKTTLLSIIAGLIPSTSGQVTVADHLVQGPSSKVGYMLQQDYLFPWRTIADNACMGLEIAGELTEEKRQGALHLLEEMGLLAFRDYYPAQLSGGMRQRVALVRTLAMEPELLLLDEPFSALDYQTKLQLEDLVVETLRAKGKTAILVTHDISEAIAMSDRILVLAPNPGRIRQSFEIPEAIRAAVPFEARELPEFHLLFRQIWQEFGGTPHE
ncbi:spermidine/putrescine ABC transporter ATP-binding protein [Paenibacillus pectinilyticus]|uniref:Spermidine/putrescine ABC transporter ATP-binding protein n=1 Tax=Paenibacillus pectinilyticus TaxID=512399 RepID=A0A1C1A0Z2_9BACL|nr:ABC transporter ATP-binding protein [Paenibacillus pectinilyticus]OCT14216.1 spermidine/putrescine ABC transporter ATP-binding protein [Paenibacillus pectinilyticus]